MVQDRLRDGKRIAELLSSEVHGAERGPLGRIAVTDADREVEPTEFGAYAYALSLDGEKIATVHVHPDRAHVAFRVQPDVAAQVGRARGLRTRPKAVEPPRTLVFVEDGAEVKRVAHVLRAVVEAVED
ncbi:hypothetical protein [Natronomonas sp. EA1]|uniref:hypothetical protein n=1 Tax=Natronomonas sp. EA1 TaxID=3421655 RepID=UPI003EBF3EB7